jgi:hypothetical protein
MRRSLGIFVNHMLIIYELTLEVNKKPGQAPGLFAETYYAGVPVAGISTAFQFIMDSSHS